MSHSPEFLKAIELDAVEYVEMKKELQEYKATKLSEPIKIDGNWDKPAWATLNPLEINQHILKEPDHRPKVLAKIAWDDSALYLIFHVEDRYVRAVAKKHHDPVYEDSCVEFFFTPGPELGLSYFNIEMNCGGTMLFAWHPEGREAISVTPADCDKFTIGATLPKIVDPEIEKAITWSVEYRLPFDVIKKYCPEASQPTRNVIWKANLYKCADKTSHPHWLTWSLVDHPTPQFHLPAFFGTLKFE